MSKYVIKTPHIRNLQRILYWLCKSDLKLEKREENMNKADEDEIDEIPEEPESCEIKSPSDHRLMFKTLENKLRRLVVKSIGEYGKTKEDIMKEVDITESQLDFQLDYLIKECYVEFDGTIFILNDKGKDELLVNIIAPLK
jgi:hypothetical protein